MVSDAAYQLINATSLWPEYHLATVYAMVYGDLLIGEVLELSGIFTMQLMNKKTNYE